MLDESGCFMIYLRPLPPPGGRNYALYAALLKEPKSHTLPDLTGRAADAVPVWEEGGGGKTQRRIR